MSYKRTPINPLSGQRLRDLLKEKGYTHESFSEIVDVTPDYIGHMCQGRRAISSKRAEEFGKILGVRPEYLLGVDDFPTFNRGWLSHNVGAGAKKRAFFEQCLDFWGYSIVGEKSLYSEDEDGDQVVSGFSLEIKKPTGEIVTVESDVITRLEDDLARSARRYIKEALDPED